jgi:CHASE1-domain containing sensor protein
MPAVRVRSETNASISTEREKNDKTTATDALPFLQLLSWETASGMILPTGLFRKLLTSLLWLCGVALSLLAYFLVDTVMDRKAHSQFMHKTGMIQSALEAELESYAHILRSAQALAQSQLFMTRDEFHRYARYLDFVHHYPALRTLNYAFYVRQEGREVFEKTIRDDTSLKSNGYPDFAIKPSGDRLHYHVLTYLESLNEYPEAIGFDMLTIPNGDVTFNLMRDYGMLVSSGHLIPIPREPSRFAIAMRLPVYRKGMPTASVEQRRAALIASVGIAVDVQALMDAVISHLNRPELIRITITDQGYVESVRPANTPTVRKTIYDNNPQGIGKQLVSLHLPSSTNLAHSALITVASRQWELSFNSDRTLLLSPFDRYLSVFVLVLGLFASFLLSHLFHAPHSARRRAVQLANEMTKDLRRSEAHLAEAQQMANLGSWQLDPASQTMQWSLEAFRIFGHPPTTPFLRRLPAACA